MMMQQAVLYKLIDAISDLVCHHRLHAAVKGDAVQALARAHLFVALRQLDGLHKGLALQFLYEANLIGAHVVADSEPLAPVLALNGADLRGMVLPQSNLGWAHLAVSDLSRADLRDACLIRANLYAVDLVDADLANANLCGANLFMADITGANLDGADLRSAFVSPAQLAAAKVTSATRLPDSV
ncbi:pentapeptide repeat-containing protein [Caldilinea sp.]|uniref:pentapeptide repeat-containing protein n=1 Tax=Caldilinea sp. TaxID=2293560 RepID=UPI002C1EF9B8|nr:pentapeptide repeat-containing protein [Anaerolineales bacterium]HQY94640.1 pentapeptide repeat-containing protein [Caldilinea sp.]HRA65879.1 pentapeptide repeat-containing protein [Caldilinea sp.]